MAPCRLPNCYDALRPLSLNLGEVDYAALIAGRPQTVVRNPNAAFRLFRIGDAVASRNIHAAIYDALRLAKDRRHGRTGIRRQAPGAGPSGRTAVASISTNACCSTSSGTPITDIVGKCLPKMAR